MGVGGLPRGLPVGGPDPDGVQTVPRRERGARLRGHAGHLTGCRQVTRSKDIPLSNAQLRAIIVCMFDNGLAAAGELTITLPNHNDDVFDRLVANDRRRRDAETAELMLIAEVCDTWAVDEDQADIACEKLVAGGADGAALVGEFLSLELACLLQISAATAALKIRRTLNLRDRHPGLWDAVCSGRVEPWKAHAVVADCADAGLSAEAAGWVDRQICTVLDGLGWQRAIRGLAGLITAADPALAAERARLREQRRLVHIGSHREGGSELYARLNTEDAVALAQTIDTIAHALSSGGTSPQNPDQRRSEALGILADPQHALDLLNGQEDASHHPKLHATVVVHLNAESLESAGDTPERGAGVARIERISPLDTDTLRRFLGQADIVVRPVIDLNQPPTVDAYEIPTRLRQTVCARNPVEVFPYSSRPARGCDLDHTVPYDRNAPPGSHQTRADNLGPLSRTVHRAKTAGLWRMNQVAPGEFEWTSPTGYRYHVALDRTTPLGRVRAH